MNPSEDRLQYLFRQYLSGKITQEEYVAFWQCLKDEAATGVLSNELAALWEQLADEPPEVLPERWRQKMQQRLSEDQAVAETTVRRKRRVVWWAAAAAVLAVAGFYFLQQQRRPAENAASGVPSSPPLARVRSRQAMLTLSGGRVIALDSAANGVLARQAGSLISKVDKGKLQYAKGAGTTVGQQFNTLTTPVGGQFELQLSDGTKVWLNATSSVRFPAAFNGTKRMVEVKGEAYFEVAPDPKRPFIVRTGPAKIKVLGTHFNVQAYADEPQLKATLLEGKISVNQAETSVILAPNEQAQIVPDRPIRVIKNIKPERIMAWHNNLFWFQNDDIYTVMREIARWYDVEVIIEKAPTRHFTGSVSRSAGLSRVLQILQETGGVHFKKAGKKVTVTI